MDADVTVPAKRRCLDAQDNKERENHFYRDMDKSKNETWIKCTGTKRDLLTLTVDGLNESDCITGDKSANIENYPQETVSSRKEEISQALSSPETNVTLSGQEANESLSEVGVTNGKLTLWQFLLELLLSNRYTDFIRWTNRKGEFVLLQAEGVAKLWGMRKDRNHRMNYDKLSRALRYYYEKNIIRKVHGHKFVYQFIGLRNLIKFCEQNSQEVTLPPRDWDKISGGRQSMTKTNDQINIKTAVPGTVNVPAEEEEHGENLVMADHKQQTTVLSTKKLLPAKMVDVDLESFAEESSTDESMSSTNFNLPESNHRGLLSFGSPGSGCLIESISLKSGLQTCFYKPNQMSTQEQFSQEQLKKFSSLLSTFASLSSLFPSLSSLEQSVGSSGDPFSQCSDAWSVSPSLQPSAKQSHHNPPMSSLTVNAPVPNACNQADSLTSQTAAVGMKRPCNALPQQTLNESEMFHPPLNLNPSVHYPGAGLHPTSTQHPLLATSHLTTGSLTVSARNVINQHTEQRSPTPHCHCSCHDNSSGSSKQAVSHPSPPLAEPNIGIYSSCASDSEHRNRTTQQVSSPTESSPSQLHHQRHTINMQRLSEQLCRLNRLQSTCPSLRTTNTYPHPNMCDMNSVKLPSQSFNTISSAPGPSNPNLAGDAPINLDLRPHATDKNNQCVWMPVPVEMLTSWFNLLNTMVPHQDTNTQVARACGNPVPMVISRHPTDQFIKTERPEDQLH
ncbi:hypothetical protein CSKR_107921 [Clonorchis sinensis]|uniref:Uncharacterized protein n=1 Tax=Clonorchis sinensis TaxID=79923 RepID=A0A3R7ERH2_CLOSI|nr:hypothetical protein CSKR_107921 [Clonorchis sinensis]